MILKAVREVLESDEELTDDSGKGYPCLCHEMWFDSPEALEEHLKEQQ